jgi:N-acetylglucosaminyldiphosphoundecaprenol N-acetyl-beta-D-mannosaminyltransferase
MKSHRHIYCLLGLPLDAISMNEALEVVRAAVADRQRLFLSTPNLNFLIGSRQNPSLRNSVIHSDLSVADGMPLVWMARLLGLPIRERVTGSGLFERLLGDPVPHAHQPIRVYFFGGPPGAAALAHDRVNESSAGVISVGHECPGFGSVEAMSGDDVINAINKSQADFLVVALGAAKGQAWIEHNLSRLTVPVISHLGAVVNFAAGTLSRAPAWVQRSGLEWVWRIKEEPGLWRRYWNDGRTLLSLLLTRLLPYAAWLRVQGLRQIQPGKISFISAGLEHTCQLVVVGDVTADIALTSMRAFDQAATVTGRMVVDLGAARWLGAGFWAQLLLLKASVEAGGGRIWIEGITPIVRDQMRWNGVDYLLTEPAPGIAN